MNSIETKPPEMWSREVCLAKLAALDQFGPGCRPHVQPYIAELREAIRRCLSLHDWLDDQRRKRKERANASK